MSYRPRDIYRGRRKYRVPLTIALTAVGVLIIGAIALFYILQQYLVYDQTGVSLQLPFMQTAQPQDGGEPAGEVSPTFAPVEVELVYEAPDFTDVDLGGWQELAPTRALFVPYEDAVSQTKLAAAVSQAVSGDYTGLLLNLKDPSGQLAWASSDATALDYGASGAMDLSETLTAIHEAGLTAAAQLSCCADELMAKRNWTVTLRTPEGQPYVDADGVYWLDPYNRTVRGYLASLAEELVGLGFDEIVFTDLRMPVDEAGFSYSVTLQTEADPINAVCQMGQRLAEAVAGAGATASVCLDATSLRERQGALTGQELDILWRLFARVYCPSSAQGAASDLELAAETMRQGDAAVRFAPICGSVPEGMGSYVINPLQ